MGEVPFPVAVLVTAPLSMSAWVTAYVAVQVPSASGARTPGRAEQSRPNAPAPGAGSLTETPVMVTLPELVTVIV